MRAMATLLALIGVVASASISGVSSSAEAASMANNDIDGSINDATEDTNNQSKEATLGDRVSASEERNKLNTQRFLSEDGGENGGEDEDDGGNYDDFWSFDDGSSNIVWSDYALEPKKCMILNKKHLIAFKLYGKGHKECARKQQGTYTMDVGQFSKAYVAQKKVDYELQGADYGDDPEALNYVDCTQVEYNDNVYYAKLGCTSAGALKILSYSDSSCANEINTNLGLYNDIKITFNTCKSCVTWPSQSDDNVQNANGDGEGEGEEQQEVQFDDNFEYYHQFESKLCSAANFYKQSCGWGCKREANKTKIASSVQFKKGWTSFEKFFLVFWTITVVGLVWVVLKQRRMMSREDAIVEEAAMNGVGLKKRHIFPIALGIIFFTILSMFMVWKHLTWFLLIGANVGLFAHFVFLRRKARKMAGASGYVKDGGLQIS